MQENIRENNSVEAAREASRVTPKKRNARFARTAQLAALLLVCVVILIVMALPEKTHATTDEEEGMRESRRDVTLEQNLEMLERLRKTGHELPQRPVALDTDVQEAPVVDGRTPPKLRHHADGAVLSKEMRLRMNAPTSFDIEGVGEGAGSSAGAVSADAKTLQGSDANSQFLNEQNDITSVSAKRLPHPLLTVPAGEMIPATLETAINSDLAGMARAITTRDVYSLKGGNLLIPAGATLIGQFNAAVVEGQSRIFVVWNRVQMSDGVIATLNSPGTDMLGRSGQGADYVNRHFFERFGTSALLSVIGAYSAVGGVGAQDEYNSRAQYRAAIADSFQQSASEAAASGIQIKPTLQVNQGTRINVFVAHDIDFARIGKRSQNTARHRGAQAWK